MHKKRIAGFFKIIDFLLEKSYFFIPQIYSLLVTERSALKASVAPYIS